MAYDGERKITTKKKNFEKMKKMKLETKTKKKYMKKCAMNNVDDVKLDYYFEDAKL